MVAVQLAAGHLRLLRVVSHAGLPDADPDADLGRRHLRQLRRLPGDQRRVLRPGEVMVRPVRWCWVHLVRQRRRRRGSLANSDRGTGDTSSICGTVAGSVRGTDGGHRGLRSLRPTRPHMRLLL